MEQDEPEQLHAKCTTVQPAAAVNRLSDEPDWAAEAHARDFQDNHAAVLDGDGAARGRRVNGTAIVGTARLSKRRKRKADGTGADVVDLGLPARFTFQ